jgi:hypothetical protein
MCVYIYHYYRIIIQHMFLLYALHHTPQIILTSDIFIIIYILFYYWTLNFDQKYTVFTTVD